MSDLPWFQFFPSDWLAGTRGLSVIETGVYITLIAMMYDHQAPIVEDAGRLSRACGARLDHFTKALETLVSSGKVLRVDGKLWNARVARNCELRAQKCSTYSSTAKARWDKKRQEKQSAEDANALQSQSDGNVSQKPDTIRKVKNLSDSRRAKRAAHPIPDNFVPSDESWYAVRDMGFSDDDQNFGLAELRDWAIGKDERRSNWDSVYRNWFRKDFRNGKTAKPQRNTIADGFAKVDAFYESRQRSAAGRSQDGGEADHGELPRLWESAA
jgi:uncharacterized protein YdaU (DUF1376 family)